METYKGKFTFALFPFAWTSYIPFTLTINELKHNSIYDNYAHEYVREIDFDVSTTSWDITIKYQNTSIMDTFVSLPQADVLTWWEDRFESILTSIGSMSGNSSVDAFYTSIKNLFDFSVNAIFFYRNNSSKNTVSKSLVWVKTDEVKYTRPIQYKQMVLDVKRSADEEQYNYIFLTVLNRYYYVTDAVLTNDFASLTLYEDVLMSFSELIRLQDAFITRNENSYDDDIVDDYVVCDYNKTITTTTITDSLNLFENIGTVEQMDYRYVLTVISKV